MPQASLTLVLYLSWAWFVMTISHELGHVVAGVLGGAQLIELEIRPWQLPHSTFVGDGNPQLTLWAGPILGSLIPLSVAAIARRPACWFVGWFCLLANGAYLLLGLLSGEGELDSGRLLRVGVHPLAIWLAVLASVPLGYVKLRARCIAIVNGATSTLPRRAMYLSAALLVGVLILQAILGTAIRSG